jgi:hypothetical protein
MIDIDKSDPVELHVSTHDGVVSEICAAPDEVADMLAKIRISTPVMIFLRDDRKPTHPLLATVWPNGGIDWEAMG